MWAITAREDGFCVGDGRGHNVAPHIRNQTDAEFFAHARADLLAALEAIKSMERTVATEFDRAEDAECRLASALEALEETHGRGEVLWRTLEEWLLLQRIFGGSTSEEYIIELEHQLAVARKDTKHWQANHDQQVAFKRVTAEKRDEFKAERDRYQAQAERLEEALEEAQGKLKAVSKWRWGLMNEPPWNMESLDAILRGTKEEK